MQETETIGTPNAIWTWMCRDCGAPQRGVSHRQPRHRRRNNVCTDNGRGPRLARRQGAIFLWTSNGGKLKGVELSGNRIFWNPPAEAAALVNAADFLGGGEFHGNTIQSTSPLLIRSRRSLLLDHNTYEYRGEGGTRWDHGGKLHSGFRDYRQSTGQDPHSRELHLPVHPTVPPGQARTRGWTLTALISASPDDLDSRGQVNLIESVHRQFPALAIRIVPSLLQHSIWRIQAGASCGGTMGR